MKITILLLVTLVVVISASYKSELDLLDSEWETFKLEFNKSYFDEDEEYVRKETYLSNRQMIANHNTRYANGEESYWLEMNQFGDIPEEEFKELMDKPVDVQIGEGIETEFDDIDMDIAEMPRGDLDWRKKGAVTRVTSQGHCNAGYAFATAGVIEGQYRRKRGKLVDVSEQNIVDCSSELGNAGCTFGNVLYGLIYVKERGGVEKSSTYPYTGKYEYCRYNRFHRFTNLTTVYRVRSSCEKYMTYSLTNVGPLAVTINSLHPDFRFYRGGVYDNKKCSSIFVNHGSLLVGYGTKPKKYWLIKNSWGTNWGEKGYVRIAKDKRNICGVMSFAFYGRI